MKVKSTVETLTIKQRTDLALGYDSVFYKALKAFIEAERFNIATKLLDVAPDDVTTIARHQGRAIALKELHLELKRNYEAQNREDEPKKQKR